MSSVGLAVVDMRHWTFGWAMTLRASMATAAPAATSAPVALAMNRRRSVTAPPGSPRHESVIRALGNLVPGPHQRVELRERRVRLPRHGARFGLVLHHLGGELLQLSQHGQRILDDLHLALEFGPEPVERDRVLGVEIRRTVEHHGGGGMIEHSPQIARQGLVRLLVEDELARGPGLVPAGVVVVSGGLMETELHVVVWSDELGGVDDAAFEGGVDLARGQR